MNKDKKCKLFFFVLFCSFHSCNVVIQPFAATGSGLFTKRPE